MKERHLYHKVVYDEFMCGKFIVHQVQGTFNGVWNDLDLEQTYKKEGKTTLLKGIPQAPAATEKYVKSVPFLTKLSESIKTMVGWHISVSEHHGQSQKKTKGELQLVIIIKEIIAANMIIPFTCTSKTDLLHIATEEKCFSTDLADSGET